ncbi:hypothetical protein H4582DRAFT_1267243 [Lactarius indigo]|nr:hypothetical protein H4582DRAFT_1267243 [Lactarius indigo]
MKMYMKTDTDTDTKTKMIMNTETKNITYTEMKTIVNTKTKMKTNTDTKMDTDAKTDDDEDQNGDEYEYFQTISRVPSRVYTEGKPHLLTAPIGGVSSHPRSDEPAGIEDLTFAKKLRRQARRKGREMSEAYRRAESARKEGRFQGLHSAHAQDAIAHEREMRELDKRAAKIFFRENNKGRGGDRPSWSVRCRGHSGCRRFRVRTARWRGDGVVSFVVGKGLHSDAGEAKIRPALEDLFTERGLGAFPGSI